MTTKTKQRKITGTDFYAVTFYRANDRSYSTQGLYASDGTPLGTVTSHSKRLALSAGWHEGWGSYDHRLRSWSTLAEAAQAFVNDKPAPTGTEGPYYEDEGFFS